MISENWMPRSLTAVRMVSSVKFVWQMASVNVVRHWTNIFDYCSLPWGIFAT